MVGTASSGGFNKVEGRKRLGLGIGFITCCIRFSAVRMQALGLQEIKPREVKELNIASCAGMLSQTDFFVVNFIIEVLLKTMPGNDFFKTTLFLLIIYTEFPEIYPR